MSDKGKKIRIIVGLFLLGLVPFGYLWGLIGLVPIIFATAGYCPLPIGKCSIKKQNKEQKESDSD